MFSSLNQKQRPIDGVVVVAEEHEVHSYCLLGYRLLDVVYSEHVEIGCESTTDNENGYNNSYGTRTHSVSKPLVVRKAKFVMVQREEDALAQKQAELKAMEVLLHERATSEEEAVKNAAACAKTVSEQTSLVERLRSDVRDVRDAMNTSIDRNRALEKDIAKIRSAVGELKMKEILAG
jgi:hypothetical protein